MAIPIVRPRKYHGTPDHGLSRYLALYAAQLGWVLLGIYLLRNAYWPSSCTPHTIVQVYTCSVRLPENRHIVESVLMTWLWSTPILILLDVSRRYSAWAEKRAR